METNTLTRQFRNVVSLASLAYISSGNHAIQYSLLQLEAASDYNMDDSDTGNNDHNLQEPGNAEVLSVPPLVHMDSTGLSPQPSLSTSSTTRVDWSGLEWSGVH